uniref:Uncharacterized protein n=1 Tax=Pararge aegeria TaxID=116150 RepID=S4PK66_9NEOP
MTGPAGLPAVRRRSYVLYQILKGCCVLVCQSCEQGNIVKIIYDYCVRARHSYNCFLLLSILYGRLCRDSELYNMLKLTVKDTVIKIINY